MNITTGEKLHHIFLKDKANLKFMPQSGGLLSDTKYVFKVASLFKERYGVLDLDKAFK